MYTVIAEGRSFMEFVYSFIFSLIESTNSKLEENNVNRVICRFDVTHTSL